jgi:hypothetical protein
VKSLRFKWGGEIEKWQKDIMHFLPSGIARLVMVYF